VETKETNAVKAQKPQNCQGRYKNEKPSSTKSAISAPGKKNNNNKEMKTTSNSALCANAQPRQPGVKTRSFNDHQVTNNNLSRTKAQAPAASNIHKAKVDAIVILLSGVFNPELISRCQLYSVSLAICSSILLIVCHSYVLEGAVSEVWNNICG